MTLQYVLIDVTTWLFDINIWIIHNNSQKRLLIVTIVVYCNSLL